MRISYSSIFIFFILLGYSTAEAQNSGAHGEATNLHRSFGELQAQGFCQGFDFSGKVVDGYFAQHGGGKVKVRIPVDYLLFPETGSTFTEKSDGMANFNFHRDTLKPYPRREMQGKVIAGKEEWISFLITDFIEMKLLAKLYTNLLSGRKAKSNEPPFPEKQVSANLFQVQLPSRVQPDWEKRNLYLGRDGGAVTDVISCNIPQPNQYPHCEHLSRLGGYDVKVLYPLDQFTNWKVIKKNIQSLLECMTD